MTKRMLIDATHSEETRVVVLNGNRLEEFDFETSTKKQLKGNIYLAKVTRVEPSLQAAFVDFGGNRHGFLAFNEIHPDYYQIPVADRMALIKEEEALAAEALEAGAGVDEDDGADHDDDEHDDDAESTDKSEDTESADESEDDDDAISDEGERLEAAEESAGDDKSGDGSPSDPSVEEVGGEDAVEIQSRERPRGRPRRQRYKIQEVIKRRQIILVQVVKEERGNKGAALTTYLSLAGRYCVLMPNTTKGGGISRKITSPKDRNRLKGFISDLDIPDGVAVILRTAAVERSKAEIRRDFEYLIRTWHLVRDTTLKSIAPTLVYEEGNLIKRSIRDLYSKDMDSVLVEGEEGYKTAKDFMRMLMPSHARRVQPYKDDSIPLFHRYQVESQIDAMHSPEVKLKSGGYIVINPTEALVSIDVNSGRATRERNIEETAYKTNLEAAEEIARQLKLRDLAGLIVIDFIDMMENRNQHTVERRLKEAMRADRARIQIGRISPFGLLELSRQRLRPSLLEASTEVCPHCEGTGLIRSVESAALHVLRAVEEEGIRRRSTEIAVEVATPVALYILNEKRGMLTDIETRHGFRVLVTGDNELVPPAYRLERTGEKPGDAPAAEEQPAQAEAASEEKPSRRRRRRRPRRGEEGEPEAAEVHASEENAADSQAEAAEGESEAQETAAASEGDNEQKAQEKPKRRRRGRRGGRRQSRAKAAAKAKEKEQETREADSPAESTAEQNQEAQPTAEEVTGAAAEAGADETSKPKRRSRSRRPRSGGRDKAKEQVEAAEEATADGESDTIAANAEDQDAEAKSPSPRRRRPRKRPEPTPESDPTPATEPAAEIAAASQGNGAGAEESAPTNGSEAGASDTGNGKDDHADDAPEHTGTEDQPPEPKRQGWWNRLTR